MASGSGRGSRGDGRWGRLPRLGDRRAPPRGASGGRALVREHRPAVEPPTGLLWGDVRLGNVVFDATSGRPTGGARLGHGLGRTDGDGSGLAPRPRGTCRDEPDGDGSCPGSGPRPKRSTSSSRGIDRGLVDLEWYEIFALIRASALSSRGSLLLFERQGQQRNLRDGASHPPSPPPRSAALPPGERLSPEVIGSPCTSLRQSVPHVEP